MMKEKVLLIIMDGIGINDNPNESAIKLANTPILDRLLKDCPNVSLKAHGTSVGLPSDDDMGNSEVGHNALGCGQIYNQGAKLVDEAILSGKMFSSSAWSKAVNNCKQNNSTLHFIGLLSDGNVHSNISHLIKMIENAKNEGVRQIRCHILLDGRDVPSTSALQYVDKLENCLVQLNDDTFCGKIASGGGRMKITMDRYQADWDMVKCGWEIHVHGNGRKFSSASDAINTYRSELNCIDQDLPGFVVCDINDKPVGTIEDNDSVILFNFRGDRAIEISMAFENAKFEFFDRGRKPNVFFAGMLQYDGDLELPLNYLVAPPEIHKTLSELLIDNNIYSLAISETQKYGHITYFWNGNRSEKFNEELEVWQEIKSDNVPFDQRPWMKCAEITDAVINGMSSKKYQFIRCNFPNGDMVGHTGSMPATIISVESLDLCLKRLLDAADEYGYTVVITADHGNADQMFDLNKKGEYVIRTAHSLNRVPFIVYSKEKTYNLDNETDFGLSNVAATIASILKLKPYKEWQKSIIKSEIKNDNTRDN